MKIKLLVALMTVSLVVSCATTPKAPDDLDLILREVSDYLNTSIPRGNKIAFINVQSDSEALTEYIIDELIANAVNDRIFSVVDRQQLDVARAELNFNMSGEVSDQSAQQVGRMLGAQTIITGRVTQIGDRYRLNIRALETETVRMQGSNNWNLFAGKTFTDLLKSGSGGRTGSGYGTSTASSTNASTSNTARTTARPTPPPNGTYTFYPRLQAIQGATPCRVYLDRVVSRNGFLSFYLYSVPLGRGDGVGNPWAGTGSGGVYLQDLDNPRNVWNTVDAQFTAEGVWGNGTLITFRGVTGRRFLLNSGDGYGNIEMIFEEIILNQPDE